MYKASAGVVLPTSIIGSLPRPSWYNAVLGSKSFLEAMINARYREQYEDAVSSHLRAQETAGLDAASDPGAPDYPYGELGAEQRSRSLAGGR